MLGFFVSNIWIVENIGATLNLRLSSEIGWNRGDSRLLYKLLDQLSGMIATIKLEIARHKKRGLASCKPPVLPAWESNHPDYPGILPIPFASILRLHPEALLLQPLLPVMVNLLVRPILRMTHSGASGLWM
jgi:hypothetical protein